MLDQWQRHGSLPDVAKRRFFQDDMLVTQKVQDVEPILDRNRRIANETDGRTPGGGRYLGSIPATVYYDWIREWTIKGLIGPGHMEPVNDLIKQRLRDSDFSKLRTTSGGI